VIALVAVAGLGATASPVGAATVPSVLKVTKAAIGTQTSVHVDFSAISKSSKVSEQIVADVSATGGSEIVSEGTGSLAIRVTATAGYVTGNATGLTNLYGLSAAEVKKIGSNWVSFKAGTSQYKTLKSDVTFSSVRALLPKSKGTKVSTKVTQGVTQYLLKWTTPASKSAPKLKNSLTVAATAPSLPIEEIETDSTGVKVTTTLTKWGEIVPVADPPATSTIDSSQLSG
jgi:hypothetical protein